MRLKLPGFVWHVLFIASLLRCASADAAPPATAPFPFYDHIVSKYLAGEWDEVTADLVSGAKEVSALPPAQKADVEYIRKTMAECRPAWWKTIKAGKPVKFRPVVWGHALSASWSPVKTEPNTSINYANGVASVGFTWNAQDMDDPKVKGEVEFTNGEKVDETIWNLLGKGASWTEIPPRTQLDLKEPEKVRLLCYLEFRGNLGGAYYTTPRARRWAIWNSISGWSHEYDKKADRTVRRTIGILLNEEVLAHPEIYKTIPRPKEPPADGAESKMVWELQEWIRHHDLSLSEDKAFREAVKSLAAANELQVRATGKVALPNGLAFSLDPDADKALSAKRDAWIKQQYTKVAKP